MAGRLCALGMERAASRQFPGLLRLPLRLCSICVPALRLLLFGELWLWRTLLLLVSMAPADRPTGRVPVRERP